MKFYLLLALFISCSLCKAENLTLKETENYAVTSIAKNDPGQPLNSSNHDNHLLTKQADTSNSSFPTDLKAKALTQLQTFDVIAFFSPYDKLDETAAYSSLIDSLKKIGKVTITEDESMLCSLLQNHSPHPICYFSIEENQDLLEVSLHVIAEVTVAANQYKTACPIWKKKLFSPTPPDDAQTIATIENLAKKLIESLGVDWEKANESNEKQPFFHVKKFKSL